MEKKIINKNKYKMIKDELNYFEKSGFISATTKESLLSIYEVKNPYNFIKVILLFAVVLIGVGILSFIASNWDGMGKGSKFSMIILFLGLCDYGAFVLEKSQQKIARSLLYLGCLVYGAGIFLIGQIFHYSAAYSQAFFLWSLGLFPMALLFKEKIIFSFAQILLFVYALSVSGMSIFYDILVVVALYFLSFCMPKFTVSKFIYIVGTLILLGKDLFYFDMDFLGFMIIFFSIGLAMSFSPFSKKDIIVETIGTILYGAMGIALTIPELYGGLIGANGISFIFGIFYFVFLLYVLNRGKISSIILICALILRYYADISYDFMPKSLFFIFGGLVLGAFGIWFDKQRKKRGQGENE